MKRTLASLTGVVVAALCATGALVAQSGAAHAATTPPWEPDSSSVGGLLFFDSAGNQITSGSTSDPISAYAAGKATIRSGDNVATLFGYLPVQGQAPGQWSGEQLSGSTTYPNHSAPGALGATSLPVVTGAAGDETVAELAADYPNTSSTGGYAHTYQIRLVTSKPQEGVSPTYDAADISISGGTWSLVYTKGAAQATTTALSVSKSGSVFHGTPVKLTATVSPSAATGSVQFRDGSRVLKTVPVSGGKATYTVKTLSDAKHHLTAKFAPGSSSYTGSVSAAKLLTVKAHSTSVKLKASKAKIKVGKKLTLTAKESPAVSGKVTFLDGSKKLGKPVTVKSGKAVLSTSKLAKGTHALKAKFVPKSKADDAPSTSKPVTLKVTG